MESIKKQWTSVKSPAAFSGENKLQQVSKKSPKLIKSFLQKQFTYQLHKPIKKRFHRRAIIVAGPNILWDVDLLDLKEFQNKNFRNRYILMAVDVFSRKAYGQAMTNKSARTTSQAFEKILQQAVPQSIRSDHGNEFKGEFNRLLKSRSIKHILTSSPEIKANFVERFHRTFRDKLMKFMTYYSNQNWTRVYKSIIESYNNTPHSSLNKIAPNNVNSENIGDLLAFMLRKKNKCTAEQPLDLGQLVRITSLKKSFTKASKHTFTDELFRIKEVSNSCPKTYKLEDLLGEPITGAFYQKELQVAEPNAEQHKRIGKIINKGKGEYKVHFKNWPKKFDTILSKAELKFYEQPK